VHHRLESKNLLQMMFQTRASQLGKFMVRKHCCDSDGFRVTLLRRTRNFLSVRSWFGQTRFPLSFPLTFLKVSAEGMIIWKNKLVGGSTHLKKISQNGNLPQLGMKRKKLLLGKKKHSFLL